MICEEAVFRVIEDINRRLDRGATYREIVDEVTTEFSGEWEYSAIDRAVRKLAEKGRILRHDIHSKKARWWVNWF